MRLLVIAGAGALAWMSTVSAVLSADIPAAPVLKAPVQAPGYSWYGFFIGVHGGYGWGRDAVAFTPDAFYAPLVLARGAPAAAAPNPEGFVGGIHYGSNWQFGRIVLGTDSDFSYSDIKASQVFASAIGGVPFTATTTQRLKWFGTTRGRAGVLVTDNVLLYATGGLATGRIESSSAHLITLAGGCLIPGGCPAGSIGTTKWGWAAGGGIEYGAGPWSLKVEYLHYDLGTVNYLLRDLVVPAATINASVRTSGDMVRAGVSYRFNWTPWGLIFGTDRI
jgi:outer membrane immunogenic protein